jgi:uncharacterized protein YndB with AHSA1/START domain
VGHGSPPGRARRHQFTCFTAASPAKVWSALTVPCQTSAYLYGLAAHSSWRADDPIQFRIQGQDPVTGRVLHVRVPWRLSYLLQSGPGDPPVYLTWQIRPCTAGCVIRLQVDEVDAADSEDEAESVWLPVLAALQELLAQNPQAHPAGPGRATQDQPLTPDQ